MNRLMIGALALSLVAPAAASAQVVDRDVVQRQNGNTTVRTTKVRPSGRTVTTSKTYKDNGAVKVKRKWNRGQRLPAAYRSRNYYVDYRAHKLRAPPRGHQWVRVDGEYVLVALATGLIVEAILSQ